MEAQKRFNDTHIFKRNTLTPRLTIFTKEIGSTDLFFILSFFYNSLLSRAKGLKYKENKVVD
jgi:hypothetical protein